MSGSRQTFAPTLGLDYVNTNQARSETAITSKFFANADAAEAWFAENDPEGVAIEYEVLE